MPLLGVIDNSPSGITDPTSINPGAVNAEYLIFYSSVDQTGQMWCPDCRRVGQLINDAFDKSDGPSARIIYVGQRTDWRGNAENPYRGPPWSVNSVPTVLRVRDDARLVDDAIDEQKLTNFLQE